MWKKLLKDIIREKKNYEELVNRGVTDNELSSLNEKSLTEFAFRFPVNFTDVLKEINGLEFNGTILYGTDEYLLDSDDGIEQRIYGLIEYNKIWYEVETNKQFIFLGESNISWFVYEKSSNMFCELDNPSGELIEKFNTIEELLEKMLKDALE